MRGPTLDSVLELRAGSAEAVAGIVQAINLRSVPRPFLDLVEVAPVGDQRVGGLFVVRDSPLGRPAGLFSASRQTAAQSARNRAPMRFLGWGD